MYIDYLTNDLIHKFIPNTLAEVAGETNLADKLAPFITHAKIWLEQEFLGPDDFLSDKHTEFALKILVSKAFADAIPSLDLIVTPNGMAVISTDNLAPASKERVERLISSLNNYVEANLSLLIDICRTYKHWSESERGRYFCSTFLSSLSDLRRIPAMKGQSYDYMRMRCISVENELAERYIGRNLMKHLRELYNDGKHLYGDNLFSTIRHADIMMIDSSPNGILDQHRLWQFAKAIIIELGYYPDLKQLWDAEMGDSFHSECFTNNIKGSFFF